MSTAGVEHLPHPQPPPTPGHFSSSNHLMIGGWVELMVRWAGGQLALKMRQLLDNASEIEECSKGVRPLLFLCFLPHLNGNCAGVSSKPLLTLGLEEVLFSCLILFFSLKVVCYAFLKKKKFLSKQLFN